MIKVVVKEATISFRVQHGLQSGTGRPGWSVDGLGEGTGLGNGKEGRNFQGNQQDLARVMKHYILKKLPFRIIK